MHVNMRSRMAGPGGPDPGPPTHAARNAVTTHRVHAATRGVPEGAGVTDASVEG
jgi:hypothetical protein